MSTKWHQKIEPKGYKCPDVWKRELITYEDEYGKERTEESNTSYLTDGCKTVDISIHQYQCTVCGTIGNY